MKFLRGGIGARLIGGLAVAAALSLNAEAQTWHASDGGAGVETGRGGVALLAGGAGYISVGSTTSSPTPNTDVYVVQTNLNGGVVWQFAYDFGGNEEGYDIVELAGGGFAITGYTSAGAGGTDAFILTLNAAGGVTWLKTFGGPLNEVGNDIIQTANTDLVVAGYTTNTANNLDGLLIRHGVAACTPNPIFVNTYWPGGGNGNDYFRGVWEATIGGPGVNVGDLIVCGGTNSLAGNINGWMNRFTNLGAVIWSNYTGGNATENFNSVIELTVGAQAGNIIGVGHTTGFALSQLYVTKFAGPTGAQIAPDVSGGPLNAYTEMFSVRENLGFNPGNIILAGYTTPGQIGGDDAYVVEMTPVWGCPTGKVFSMEYGSTGNERFYSGSQANIACLPGYIFCGHTTSPALVPAGDPQNMYLVKTNNVGVTGCFELAPADMCNTPGYTTIAITLQRTSPAWGVCRNVTTFGMQGNLVFCLKTCTENRRNNHENDGIAGVEHESSVESASAYPNPVAAGASFNVQYTLDGPVGMPGSVLVSDINGTIIFEQKLDATKENGILPIGTEGWPVGTYLVKLTVGDQSQTRRIVVMER